MPSVNPEWHLMSGDAVIRTVRAVDEHCARLILNAQPDQWVVSAASLALGFVRVLPDEKCRACGVREKAQRGEFCVPCRDAKRAERQRSRVPSEQKAVWNATQREKMTEIDKAAKRLYEKGLYHKRRGNHALARQLEVQRGLLLAQHKERSA